MFDKNNPYKLRVEKTGETEHYYVSFHDGQAHFNEMEVDGNLYHAFREFEKQDKRQQNFFDRHIEHSTLTNEALNERALHLPKSVEECICDREDSASLRLAVNELPEIQRRRFLLYYDLGYTYEQIAEMEGCSIVAVHYTIEKAKSAIKKKLKTFH